jgi:hypothetical protein
MFQNQRLNVSKFNIVVHTTEKWVQNIVGQIEKTLKSLRLFIILMKKRSFRKRLIQNESQPII